MSVLLTARLTTENRVSAAPGSKLFNCLDILQPENCYANDLHENRVSRRALGHAHKEKDSRLPGAQRSRLQRGRKAM